MYYYQMTYYSIYLSGIFDLGCLHECTGIVILDLSNNNISSVSLLGMSSLISKIELAPISFSHVACILFFSQQEILQDY